MAYPWLTLGMMYRPQYLYEGETIRFYEPSLETILRGIANHRRNRISKLLKP